jgi:hypothetical protein
MWTTRRIRCERFVMLAALAAGMTILPPPATSAAAAAPVEDPAIVLISPGEGALVPADPGGIPVTFACPRAVVHPYSVSFALSPATDSQGAFVEPISTAYDPVVDSGGRCSTVFDGVGLGSDGYLEPEVGGGTIWWRAAHYDHYSGDNVVSRVGSFTILPQPIGHLRVPERMYRGYTSVISLVTHAEWWGAPVALERLREGVWVPVATTAYQGAPDFFLKLPGGPQQVRLTASLRSGPLSTEPRIVRVVRHAKRVTSGRDDGRYRGGDARMRVARRGRVIPSFDARLLGACVGLRADRSSSRLTTIEVALPRLRVAPDGGVFAHVGSADVGVEAMLRAHLRNRRFAGYLTLWQDNCYAKAFVELLPR